MTADAPIQGVNRAREVLAALGLDSDPAGLLAQPIGEQMRAVAAAVRRIQPPELRFVMQRVAAEMKRAFLPVPGPQTDALLSQADELLYGGAAGGGKTDLIVGAAEGHKLSLIARREINELDGIINRVQAIYGRDDWREQAKEHVGGGRSIKLGGMRDPDDWRHFAGRARDYMAFDEAGEFLEEQVSSIIAWCRSSDPNQRCRVIFASNPPRSAEGQWMIKWFEPWVDPTYPNPAKPGELRWFVNVRDELIWVDGPEPVEIEGEDDPYIPRSRTFIPARLGDNPFQDQEKYRATLQGRGHTLYRQLYYGDFLAGREDAAWQVIPSDWIQAARLRWRAEPPEGVQMTSIGLDVAQGGPDRTVLSPRHGTWFAPLKVYKGIDTKDGPAVAGLVLSAMRDACTVVVDMGGGWGGSAFDHLSRQLNTIDDSEKIVGFVPGAGSDAYARDGVRRFANKRAEAWWKFREALDPETGAGIALPPDPELAAELAMPREDPRRADRMIQVEHKEEIKKRLGRSPDLADAVVMAWAYGEARAAAKRESSLPARANLGYAEQKRRISSSARYRGVDYARTRRIG